MNDFENDSHERDGSNQVYHMPSLCDMMIGFPTQKGYIAYRKPEIGSWYMNAIVQVFSKHAKDTDLCAMLNMVNALISNEVTNMGRKQMSEYTSKFTKPYFYFFPGFSLEPEALKLTSKNKTFFFVLFNFQLIFVHPDSRRLLETRPLKRSNSELLSSNIEENVYLNASKRKVSNKNRPPNQLFKQTNNNLIINQTETDSNFYKNLITQWHIMFIASKAGHYWKEIAREMDICEAKIKEIDNSNDLTKKLYQVINIWIENVG